MYSTRVCSLVNLRGGWVGRGGVTPPAYPPTHPPPTHLPPPPPPTHPQLASSSTDTFKQRENQNKEKLTKVAAYELQGVSCFLIVCIIQKRRPPKSVCRQCPDYTGAYSAHGDGSVKTTLGNAAAAVGSAVAKVVGMVTGKLQIYFKKFCDHLLQSGLSMLSFSHILVS